MILQCIISAVRGSKRRPKTQKEIMAQLERIYTLYLKGYGNNKMIEECEDIFERILKQNKLIF
jgi:pentatricopeptide repeat protein